MATALDRVALRRLRSCEEAPTLFNEPLPTTPHRIKQTGRAVCCGAIPVLRFDVCEIPSIIMRQCFHAFVCSAIHRRSRLLARCLPASCLTANSFRGGLLLLLLVVVFSHETVISLSIYIQRHSAQPVSVLSPY